MYLSPEYSHDIFLSYSHGDNDHDGESELKTWSQQFAGKFRGELQLLPKFKNVSVFFDQNPRHEHGVDRTGRLSKEICDAVKGAALLAILMSPQYLDSGWCRDEREWWFKRQLQSDYVDRCVFVARIWPTADAKWPSELLDARGNEPIGFWFHQKGKIGPEIRPFGWGGRTDDKNEYIIELLALVGAIARRLEEHRAHLDALAQAQALAERLSAGQGQIVYLYAREAHRQEWDKVYRILNAHKYVVVPTEPGPKAHTPPQLREISEERVEQLRNCDALLILGTSDGVALDGDLISIGHHTRNLVRARTVRPLPCAVLDTTAGAVRTEKREGLAGRLNIGWINGSPAGLHDSLHNWLLEAKKRLGDP